MSTTISEDTNIKQDDYNFIFPPQTQNFNQPYTGIVRGLKATDNNNGIFSNGVTSSAEWVYNIPRNANQHINLNEMYIQICGKLRTATAGSTRNWFVANNWFLGMIEKCSFDLGGTTLFEENFGNRTSNIYTALQNDREDLVSGSLSKNGLQLIDFSSKNKSILSQKFLSLTGVTVVKAAKTFSIASLDTSATIFKGYPNAVFTASGLNVPINSTDGTHDDTAFASTLIIVVAADGLTATVNGTFTGSVTADIANDKIDFSTTDVYATIDNSTSIKKYNAAIEDKIVSGITDLVSFNVSIPLIQIFPGIVSLYPVFNQDITIKLRPRQNDFAVDINNGNIASNLLASVTGTAGNVEVYSIFQNNLFNIARVLTSDSKQSSLNYYSNPITTEFTHIQTINMKFTQIAAGGNEPITSSISTNYSPLLALFAIPKSNSRKSYHTSVAKGYKKEQYDGTDVPMQYEWFGSNNCSLTNLGLRKISFKTSNNVLLAEYDLGKNPLSFSTTTAESEKYYCYDLTTNKPLMLDYAEVYEEYRKARKFFGKQPEGALAFDEFIKDYCIYVVDMSSFALPRGTKIVVEVEYANWNGKDYSGIGTGSTSTSPALRVIVEGLLVLLGRRLITYSETGCSVSDIYVEGQANAPL